MNDLSTKSVLTAAERQFSDNVEIGYERLVEEHVNQINFDILNSPFVIGSLLFHYDHWIECYEDCADNLKNDVSVLIFDKEFDELVDEEEMEEVYDAVDELMCSYDFNDNFLEGIVDKLIELGYFVIHKPSHYAPIEIHNSPLQDVW